MSAPKPRSDDGGERYIRDRGSDNLPRTVALLTAGEDGASVLPSPNSKTLEQEYTIQRAVLSVIEHDGYFR